MVARQLLALGRMAQPLTVIQQRQSMCLAVVHQKSTYPWNHRWDLHVANSFGNYVNDLQCTICCIHVVVNLPINCHFANLASAIQLPQMSVLQQKTRMAAASLRCYALPECRRLSAVKIMAKRVHVLQRLRMGRSDLATCPCSV